MILIDWTDSQYGIGISQIDEQHKKLVDLINLLYSHMKEGKGKVVISQVLNELKEYTQYHFNAEEYLMVHNLYPQHKEHKAEHDKFVSDIEDLKQKYNSGHKTITIDTFDFLKNWLITHILNLDKKFGEHMKSK